MQTELKVNAPSYKEKHDSIKNHFLGWQCRVREYAMRNDEGRPSLGMSPEVFSNSLAKLASSVILILIPINPLNSIQRFRFMAKKTNDPNDRYKKVVQFLSSTFYQHIDDFDGLMTGLFPKNSLTVMKLLKEKECFLDFNYQQQFFRILCSVRELKFEDMEYKFTYWHNFLFNPNLSPESRVLIFQPDWSNSISNPCID